MSTLTSTSQFTASWQLYFGEWVSDQCTSEDDGITIDLTAGDDDTRDFDINIINRPAGDDDITTNEVNTSELPEVDDSGVHVDERLTTLMDIWEQITSVKCGHMNTQ